MLNDDKSLAHTRWNYKHHLFFITKHTRKVIQGKLRQNIGKILRKQCEIKEVEKIEVHALNGYMCMLVRIPPKLNVSDFMGFLKGKRVVSIHECHANLKYNYGNRLFWVKGHGVSTVGLNQKTIVKYIREEEAEDRVRNSISKRKYKDLFSK